MAVEVLIREADRKLDMLCTIALSQDSPWFGLSAKGGSVVPGYLYQEGADTFLQMYIQKESFSTGLQNAIKTHSSVIEKKTYYVVAEKLSDSRQIKNLMELFRVPSVITTNSYLFGKELFISFRFHSRFNEQINRALAIITESELETRIAYLGPSPGITSLLEKVNLDTPVSVLRYSLPASENSVIARLSLENDRNGLLELDPRMQTPDSARLILYSTGRINSGLETISDEEFIYESDIKEKYVVDGARLGNSSRIPRIAFFIRLKDGRLEETTFIPTVEADEYVNIFFTIKPDRAGKVPVLELYSPLEEDMWEWL